MDEQTESPSKDKQSTNYAIDCTVLCDADTGNTDNAGVPVTMRFNSKAMGFAIGLLRALDPTVEITEGKRFDLAACVGNDVIVFIGNRLYEGNMQNDVTNQYRQVK